jgi:sugar phosphate isomerase/epimerase
MRDRVLLSAGAGNIDACIAAALEHGLGIEVMAFAFSNMLDHADIAAHIVRYQRLLARVHDAGLPVTLHGPFIDLASGSPDAKVNALAQARYRQGMAVAEQLGAKTVVFHANFIASLRAPDYRTGWHERNARFWTTIGREAADRGLTLAIENMWEFEPQIIAGLLADLDMPNVRACLDVGHAVLFSDPGVALEQWLHVLGPYIVHLHLNNNDGHTDVHRPLSRGVIDYRAVLPLLRALPHVQTMVLEMNHVVDMQESFGYFNLR